MAAMTESRPPTIFTSGFFQMLLVIFLFIALLKGQRDLILFTLVLLGLIKGADVWSRFSRSRLSISTSIDKKRVFPGESIQLDLRVSNKKWLPVWLQIILPVLDNLAATADITNFTKESGLLWYQTVLFSWGLTAKKRGIYPVGPPRIAAGDLLGFFPRQINEGRYLEVIVYPRLVPLKSLPIPKRDFFGVPGSISPVLDPIYIMGTRDYHHGRPARAIHWKASARRNRLQEKIFEPSEQAKVMLLLDVAGYARHGDEGDFEQAIETAASLAVDLNHRNFAFGFVTNAKVQGGRPAVIPMGRGPRQLARILETLAGLTMTAVGDINTCVRNSTSLAGGISCVGFAYQESPATLENAGYLKRRHIPAIIFFNQKTETPAKSHYSNHYTAYGLDDILVKGVA